MIRTAIPSIQWYESLELTLNILYVVVDFTQTRINFIFQVPTGHQNVPVPNACQNFQKPKIETASACAKLKSYQDELERRGIKGIEDILARTFAGTSIRTEGVKGTSAAKRRKHEEFVIANSCWPESIALSVLFNCTDDLYASFLGHCFGYIKRDTASYTSNGHLFLALESKS